MQPREAFKLGFLARCVEEGLSPQQTCALAKTAAACLEKQSDGEMAPTLSGWITRNFTDPIKSTAETTKSVADAGRSLLPWLGAAAAAPPVLGGLTAYLKNKATDRGEDLVEETKQQELTDTYRRMADQLRRSRQLRDYKQIRKRTGQVYL